MNPLDAVSRPAWPCGTDCAYAEALTGAATDWIWCHHPAADTRMRRLGSECRRFQPAGTWADAGGQPGFSHRQSATPPR